MTKNNSSYVYLHGSCQTVWTVKCVCIQENLLKDGNAPLTFPLSYQGLSSGLHVQAQVLHHAVDAVVQSETSRLGLDGLSTDGTLVFLLAPLIDAVTAETVRTIQVHCLHKKKTKIKSKQTTESLSLPRNVLKDNTIYKRFLL